MGDARLEVRPFEPTDAASWDELVRRSWNGTFLHTRRFLSHHGDRFSDASLVVERPDGRLVGVFPAALHPTDPSRVVSHPGLTYGGLVHDGALRGSGLVVALEAIRRHYRRRGHANLGYRAVPHIYHRVPAADDLHALFRLGAVPNGCELSAAIDPARRPAPAAMRRRSLAKARRLGVEAADGLERLDGFWPVLEANLLGRHGAAPVHSLAEIRLLAGLCPGELRCVVALLDGVVVAGAVLFVTEMAVRAQYIAASERGRVACALDVVFDHCIAHAGEGRWFDFGTSNGTTTGELNDGLYRFKTSFGAGGVAYHSFDLALS